MVVTPEIRNWVEDQLASGKTREQVKASLKKSGWGNEDITVLLPEEPAGKKPGTKKKIIAAILALIVLGGLGFYFFGGVELLFGNPNIEDNEFCMCVPREYKGDPLVGCYEERLPLVLMDNESILLAREAGFEVSEDHVVGEVEVKVYVALYHNTYFSVTPLEQSEKYKELREVLKSLTPPEHIPSMDYLFDFQGYQVFKRKDIDALVGSKEDTDFFLRSNMLSDDVRSDLQPFGACIP